MSLRDWLRRLAREPPASRGAAVPARPVVEALEPRILYSADPFGASDALVGVAETRVVDPSAPQDPAPVGSGILPATLTSADPVRRVELVIIDSRVTDPATLLAGVGERADVQVETLVLNDQQAGLGQIGEALRVLGHVDAIHLVSHGADGMLLLGREAIDQAALDANASALAGWADALSADADILIYGCDVAATASGQAFVDAFGRLTGADVAASSDKTGAAASGGDWRFEYAFGLIQSGPVISAYGQQNWQGVLATYTVTSTADAGAGTLRQAIIDANGNAGADSIVFNIAGTGVHTINITSALPDITGTVALDATTDDSFAANGNRPAIVLDGNDLAADGLVLASGSGGSSIRGLVIRDFTGNGIEIQSGSDGNTIAGNYIGSLTTSGTTAGAGEVNFNNEGISTVFSSNNVIGGLTTADRNVISGNNGGIRLNWGSGNLVLGNLIGTDITGTTVIGNVSNGIWLNASSSNTVGGTAPGAGNVIGGSSGQGILLFGASSNTIQGNYIGTDASGTLNLANNQNGVVVLSGGSNNMIGGSASDAGNVIAFNALDGIAISDGTTNTILGNAVYSNGDLGIDLGTTNVTGNDAGDTDSGANNLQNFPVLTSANSNASGTTLVGTFNSNASQTYRIEFFASRPAVADSPNGEGERYLGFTTVTTDGSGNASISTTLANVWVNAGDKVTATATVDLGGGNYGDTSEFAANVTATSTGIIVVDTVSDTADGTTSSITNLGNNRGADGRISLREAILAANNTANGGTPDKIVFAIPGSGVRTLNIGGSGLPSITQALVIDATTQPGYAGSPLIELNGTGAGAAKGLVLASGSTGSTVKGLIINRFGGSGIEISGSSNHVIQGNWIGLDATGTAAAGNGVNGLYALNATGLQIGGTTAAERNVIAGNANQGIFFDNVDNSTVSGNYIGTDALGTGDVNGTTSNTTQSGIYIVNGSSGNVIGGTSTGARNVFSGNNHYGVEILGAGSQNNLVQGNYIGTTADGLSALGNRNGGMSFWGAGTGNVLGGTAAGAGNLISGNLDEGVLVGNGTSGATVQGNLIGSNATGIATLGNDGQGIYIDATSSGTLVGGTAAGAGNLIVGNNLSNTATSAGIYVLGSGNTIQGNWIGTDASGTLDLFNNGAGIAFDGGAANNLIGGTAAGAGNAIAFNDGDGVRLLTAAGTGNAILGNRITLNQGDGIDLKNDGVTANDAGDADTGANNVQNFPVLVTARTNASNQLILTGMLNSTASSYYRIEFFSNTSQDGTGHGEGQTYLGFANVATDGSGNATISTTLSVNVPVGTFISATATRSNASYTTFTDTSEFARNIAAVSSTQATLAVTTTSDTADGDTTSISALLANMGADGQISLREAITAANNTANGTQADRITFNIAGGGSQVITPLTALPSLTDAVFIDGTTQAGWIVGSYLPIVLDGNDLNANGLNFASGSTGSVVRGLVVRDFGQPGILANSGGGIQIVGNFIGALNSDGTVAGATEANTTGIQTSSGANLIGGISVGDRNYIGGNSSRGIELLSNANIVQGNSVGVAVDGTTANGNINAGVVVWSSNNLIGGTTAGTGNVFANSVSFRGVSVRSGSGNAILGNAIYGNQTLGIDLNNDDVTLNDVGDADSGPNELQNFPVLSSAVTNGTQITISGSLNSTANSYFRIEFFASATPDGTGYGEGQTYLGFVNVATDGSGNATFNPLLTVSVTAGSVISATATKSDAGYATFTDTSEFAQNVVATALNSAPVLDNAGTMTLTTITEDQTTNVGDTIAAIIASAGGDRITDADGGAVEGIAVTGLTSGNGTWQYSINAGGSWTAVGAVSDISALLLRYIDRLRFVPDALNADGASVSFRAWDQTGATAGQQGTKVDASSNGGTTPFSTATESASITVTAVNDAPGMPSVSLGSTNEDTTKTWQVATFTAGASDVDVGALKGLAIVGMDNSNGTWQYTLDGTNWLNIGAVATNNALLLAADATSAFRFVPNANWNGTTGLLQYKAWDRTSGTAGTYADASVSGGTTAFGGTSGNALSVTPVNDAPTISNGATVALTGTDENTTSSGTTVDTILTGASWAEVDASPLKGIAVTGKTGNGTWQYSTDGVTWTGFGAVSGSSALLLNSTTQVRYVPDGSNGETASFGFVAWDRTTGTASTNGAPSTGNPGAGGGTTAYSSQAASASIAVTSLNDAPVLDNSGTMTLTTITEDQTTNGGNTVASIIASAGGDRITDVDTGAVEGIAITSLTSGNGTWQYSINGGSNWSAVGAVSDNSALLLRATDLLRFVPDGLNADSASVSFRGWDQSGATAGQQGTKVDASTNGGTTAFSTATESAAITVTMVNDAPTISNGATVALTGTNEDTSSSGATVDTILTGASWTDVDTGALKGIAVTSQTGSGTWQYSTDGVTWTGFGAVSGSSALLLNSTTQVRYVPDGSNGETASFGFVAWDQTAGTASVNGAPSTGNPGAGGGTTAYSSQSATASMTVTSVNDAPTAAGANNLAAINRNPVSNPGTLVADLIAGQVTDPDIGAAAGIAVVAVNNANGTWQYSTNGGSSWTNFGSPSAGVARLLAADANTYVRFVPNTNWSGTVSNGLSFHGWDQTSGSPGGTANTAPNGGTTAFSATAVSASIIVTASNTAPTLSGANNLSAINEDASPNNGTLVSALVSGQVGDVDPGALSGIAVTAVDNTNGTWQYSLNGGGTWTDFGAPTNSAARLLAADASTVVRFVPGANWNGTVGSGITFRAWDQTSGSNGAAVDLQTTATVRDNFTTTAYNGNDGTANWTTNWIDVDGSPIGGSYRVTGGVLQIKVNNDSDLLYRQADLSNATAATLTFDYTSDLNTGSGGLLRLQVSSNGGASYTTIASFSATALTGTGSFSADISAYASANTSVRWLTVAASSPTAQLLVDNFQIAYTRLGGGSAAFSTAAASPGITVNAVNDAPVRTAGTVGNLTVTEDAAAASLGLGTLAYGPGGGGDESGQTFTYTVTAVPAPSLGDITLADGITVVTAATSYSLAQLQGMMFKAAPDANGGPATFSWSVVDSGGTANGGVNTLNESLTVTVTPVNDAPTISNGATVVLVGTNEDTTSSATTVDTILTGATWADVDTGALKGIAITSKTGNGTWQYSTDGVSWTAFGTVSGSSALLLNATSQVRYIPDGSNGETASFGFVAWDQTTGAASSNGSPSTANPGAGGGTTAYSSQAASASMTVTAVNDAPTISNGATVALAGTDEETTSTGTTVDTILTGASWTDIDSGALKGIAVTGVSGNGSWQYSTDGVTWTAFGTVSGSSALLLNSTSQVRYIPDGANAESAGFDFVAWDQTTGTASTNGSPSTANPGAGGGTTAFSSEVASASLVVSGVNDAPVLDNSGTMTLTTITEDQTASAGDTVATIIASAGGDRITDVDSGAGEGIAVTGLASGNGSWEYSIDGGSSWSAVGAVSDSSALLLRATDLLRFVPDGLNADTASVSFRAWDQSGATAGQQGTKVDASSNGGTTAFSTATESAAIAVTAVNDAPTITNAAAVALTGTDEDTTSSGTTVDTILTGASWADVDTGALKGLAVTSVTGNGTWEYSTDGLTWTAFGTVSGSSALLLNSTSQVRYIPDGSNAETASFDFVAWDQTTGTASTNGSPSTADPGAGGGTTAYSSEVASASLVVSAVNDAPLLDNSGTMTLTTITEDQTANGGNTVASIIASAGGDRITDVDTGATEGIAITSLASGNGTWEYSINGGSSWSAVGAVSDSSALLLRATDLLRFVPDGLNADSASVSFRAWDQSGATAGQQGTKVDASVNGSATPFSTATESAAIAVTAVNDAPTITNAATVVLPGTDEDTTSSGTTVDTILTGVSWADVDMAALKGIAVTSVTGNGTWQYSTDGVTWTGFGTVSGSSALLLNSTSQLRYIPDGNNGETASFGFAAWDRTTGAASTNGSQSYANPGAGGGTTAYSSEAASVSITVSDINDAPTIGNGATVALAGTDEDTTSSGTTVDTILTGTSWADVDTGTLKGLAVTGFSGNGGWEYSTDGVTWTAFGTVSGGSALLLNSSSQVRYVPDGSNAETVSFDFVAWDQTTGTASVNGAPSTGNPGAGGGTTAYSSEVASASLVVSAVNDAPVLDNSGTMTLTTITEDQTSSSGDTVAAIIASAGGDRITDTDAGAIEGIAVTGLVSGNGSWEYSIDVGSSWSAVGAVSDSSALLLRDTDLLRFVPDGLNADSASVSFRAWDQSGATAGQQGTKVDASVNGGTMAFSTATESAGITVTAINDAPTISNGATVALAGTDEDTTSSGTTVDTILTGASWADVDAGALKGLAVTSVTGNGTWEYSTDGVTWTGFGTVSGSSALLLDAASQVRYIPDGANGETASFSFIAWDRTMDAASTNGSPAYANPGAGGSATAYSSEIANASLTVTAVNDAPTITNGASIALTGTDEDTASAGTSVDSIVSSAAWADVDNGALKGIAVTGVSGNGTWEYSTDGLTWTGFGPVSGGSALLLDASTQVRYVPDGSNAETATFDFVAWDETTGTASTNGAPSTANPGAGGGTTAYSSARATASIGVTAVNDAPVLDNAGTMTLTTVTEDQTANNGDTVAAIIASAGGDRITDTDAGAIEGIAVTGLLSGNGSWEYSIDGGSSWSAVGAVSDNAALLLRDTDLLRFVPDGLNADTASVMFRAWDQSGATAGQQGNKVDASTNGGTTAFSAATESAGITVTAVNDAPTISNGVTVMLPGTDEDTTSSGTTVDTILTGASWADADAGALKGIAITGATGNGTWQYSTDGVTWTGFGTVSGSSALLLDASSQVRYIPDGHNGETATFGFVAWDRTADSASTNGSPAYGNPGAGGGTNACSSEVASANLVVTDINDAPSITNGAGIGLTGTDEDTASAGTTVDGIVSSAAWADVDNGALKGIAVTGVGGNGTWEYSTDGLSWTAFGPVSGSAALLLDAATQVRYMPDGSNAETATFDYVAWDRTTGTASANGSPSTANPGAGGGTTAYSSETASATLVVSGVNDAPVLDNAGTMTLTTITEDQTANGGNTVASIIASAGGDRITDTDAGAIEGIAVTGLLSGNGTWQYSINGGSSWSAVGPVSDNAALLLRDTDLLRFVPDALNADSASVSFRAWDQSGATAGQQGTKVNASINGGTTAFSTLTATTGITVTAVNDAPTIGNGATVVLTGTNEDTTSSSTTVDTILTGASWADVDTGALKGIAVTGKTGNGSWEYSTDGATWTAFGAVSGSSALLLDASTQVRYVPDGAHAETASFDFVAWDRTTDMASTNGSPAVANPGAGGGTSAYSSASASASITVTEVNDAPTITNGASIGLAGTDEDTASAGTSVDSIASAAAWADVDTGALKGIAVTGATGNGTWQYSTDGLTWTGFGSVSGSSALLLDATTQVRYVPDGSNAETATFAFVAWDQTTGTASANGSPSTANPGAGGGTTAYSSEVANATLVVSAVNDAPVLDNAGTMTLATINEDQATNTGDTVAAIIASAGGDRITDVDNGAVEGIAVTGLVSGNGTWQYSTDGGSNWSAVGAVSDTAALLLRDIDLLRFVPDGLNADSASVTFRAWDQTGATAGQQGTKVDASSNGGVTAFSTDAEVAGITVTAVNDAPVLDNIGTMTLTTITEDQTSSAGDTVATIIASAGGDRLTDGDSGALEGIAITSLASGNGSWEYSIDGGGNWTAVGVVSDNAALLLRDTDLLRFVPDGLNADAASVSFRGWDQSGATAGQQGTKADASVNGGTTAFSTATETADITVTAVNDAPVLDNTGTMTLTTISEDQTASAGDTVAAILASAGGDRISDVDAGAIEGIAVTGIVSGNGIWQYSIDGGGSWLAIGAVSDSSALLLRSSDSLRFVPDGLNADSASVSFRGWDQTGATAGQQGTKVDASINGGVTAFSADTGTAGLTVTAVNDAPVLDSAGTMTLTPISEDQTANAGNTVAAIIASAGGDRITDTDAGAIEGIAVTGLVSGNGSWQYSIDGGSSWAAVGAVSDNAALLLRSTDLLRFVPDGLNADAASVSFRAWDQSGATAGQQGTQADASVNGGTTAFSTATETAGITVTGVNDAPVLDTSGTMAFTPITEDQTANAGDTVAAIVASAGGDRIRDVDTGAVEGIAVTGLVSGNGTWQYSTDGGGTWSAVGPVSDSSALLLRASDSLRFVPDGLNADTASVSFRAWDQTGATTGQQGTKVDASVSGGSTAFSNGTETAGITVTAINDAPVNTLPPDITTAEDTPVRLTGLMLADVDAGTGPMTLTLQVSSGTLNAAAQGGVTVSGAGTAAVTLQGTRDALNAYLAGASAPEFVPLADFNGDVTLWMISSDLGNSGAGGALGDIDTATIRVTPVNDAPRIVSDGGAAQVALQRAENTNAVTVVMATDVDLPAQGLSFSVAGGADGALFGIDANTGALSWRASPDYERPADADGDNVYEVVVQVADGAGATAQQRISVRVADANDAPTLQLPESVQLLERAPNGTVVAQAQAADQDPGQSLSFRLLDDGAGRFAIDAATGRLSVADGLTLDSRLQRELTLVVQVSDAQGGTDQRALKVVLVAVPGAQPSAETTPQRTSEEPRPAAPALAATVVPAPAAKTDAASEETPAPSTDSNPEEQRQRRALSRRTLLSDDVVEDISDAIAAARGSRASGTGGEGRSGAAGAGVPALQVGPLNGQQALQSSVSLELTRALLAQALDVTSDISSAVSELVGRAWSTGNRAADGEAAASDDVFAPRDPEDQRPPAERLLIQLTQPEQVTGITLMAGLVWWITRGGGLIATALMGVPAWRQVDLLPVMAPDHDEADEEEGDGEPRRPAETTGDGATADVDDAGPDAEETDVDSLFDRGPAERMRRAPVF